MIADLHCHYPMHLLPDEDHPDHPADGWFHRLRERFERGTIDLLEDVINAPHWGDDWRVDLDGLERGGARTVCSVLYWPQAEFDLDRLASGAPEHRYFEDLQHQLNYVEEDLRRLDGNGERHVIAREPADLDDPRIVFAHCVEGGFHLGPDEAAVDANVRWLAGRGTVYITLAHLFFRGVAANAPAIPLLSDALYDRVFPQEPGVGLTDLGRAAVRAMHRYGVLVDVSHMRADAIDETFALLDALDAEIGRDPKAFPVIASHVGVRTAERHDQAYNLTAETITRIVDRGGVIGLILAQHQLGETDDEADSERVLRDHIDAIAAVAGTHDHTAIGSDLDGFIKPTIAGVDRATDLSRLEGWIRAAYPADADAMLHANVNRVLRRSLELSATAARP